MGLRLAVLWIVLWCVPVSAQARTELARMENTAVALVLFDDGGVTLYHKSSRIAWRSLRPDGLNLTVSEAVLRDGLHWTVHWDGKDWQVRAALQTDGVAFSVTGPSDTPMGNDLRYPFAFMPPDETYEAVMPTSEGVIFRVADAVNSPENLRKVTGMYYTYDWGGLSMPWFGLTDFNGGLLGLIETPDDSGVDLQVRGNNRVHMWHPQPVWRPSKHLVRYTRKILYKIFETGGYVEMAKWYRRRMIEEGHHVTLREKVTKTPALEKLIGALDLHIRGEDQEAFEAVAWLRDQGVKKMLINTHANRRYTDQFKQWGYLMGTYEIYTDIHPPDSLGRRGRSSNWTDGYPDDAYMMHDGQAIGGFGSGNTYRCSLMQLPLMQRLVPSLIASRGYESYFIDVVTANGLNECYSWEHPLTRSEDKQARIGNLTYIRDQGVVTGSEDVKDYAVPWLHYFEGLVTLVRFTKAPGIYAGNYPKKFAPNNDYRQFNLNERIRVPLWELVYHDAVVGTWRWNHAPDRYTEPYWGVKNDLILMVNGAMPLYVESKATLMERSDIILRSYRNICTFNERTGWEEMVDHRYLTPDRRVQESRYANGDAVIVNFQEKDHYNGPNGTQVAPMDFDTYRWK
jgi:hypothetical protein